jgi:hypothetical protein
MKHTFFVLLCLAALGCMLFVGWQLVQPALNDSREIASNSDYNALQNTLNQEFVKTPEQLLQARRELAAEVFNPSDELFAALLPKFIAGELTRFNLEQEYVVPEDDFYEFVMQQDLLSLAGPTLQPLPEPENYRDTITTATTTGVIRYAVASPADGTVGIYAVGPDSTFSGIVQISDDLRVPYKQIENVEPSSFVGDYGIHIDEGAPDEFNLMLAGTDHGISSLFYTLHQEGMNVTFSLPIITTPQMVASATWVNKAGVTQLHKWRVDYNGDGVVDFLINHTGGMAEEQAIDLLDFIVNTLPLGDENRGFYETNRVFFIESLTDAKSLNQN